MPIGGICPIGIGGGNGPLKWEGPVGAVMPGGGAVPGWARLGGCGEV